MKSRLITALAIGALSLTMVPAVASAASPDIDNGGDSTVNVTVSAGTTVAIPAIINVNATDATNAFPGQTVESPSQSVTWWSNEAEKDIYVKLDADLSKPVNTPVNGDEATSIPAARVALWETTAKGALDAKVKVTDIAEVNTATDNAADSQAFTLKVFIPQATEGTYTGNMTWYVEAPV